MSGMLPALKPRQVYAALMRAGFYVHHTSGSHQVLKHRERSELRITLPMHRKDLKRKTLESIIKQSGLSVDEFLELL